MKVNARFYDDDTATQQPKLHFLSILGAKVRCQEKHRTDRNFRLPHSSIIEAIIFSFQDPFRSHHSNIYRKR